MRILFSPFTQSAPSLGYIIVAHVSFDMETHPRRLSPPWLMELNLLQRFRFLLPEKWYCFSLEPVCEAWGCHTSCISLWVVRPKSGCSKYILQFFSSQTKYLMSSSAATTERWNSFYYRFVVLGDYFVPQWVNVKVRTCRKIPEGL